MLKLNSLLKEYQISKLNCFKYQYYVIVFVNSFFHIRQVQGKNVIRI